MKSTFNIPALVGKSKYISEVSDVISTIADNNASVLLFGEAGTGKSLIAQNIHKLRNQNKKDFFEINCRAFSDSDIEEVFKVIINLYNGSAPLTLFIANIDFMSLALQNHLLSLLKMIKAKNINLKLISSTESNLDTCIKSSQFLVDLYYAISTIIINTRPLRSRVEDILPISYYYFEQFNKQTGKAFKDFSVEAKHLLEAQFWAGNIDELINCIQRGFILSKTSAISSMDLGLQTSNLTEKVVSQGEQDTLDLKTAIDIFKKEYLTKVLEENNWNQTKTSKLLGIQRTYVIKLIKDLNIKK